MAWQSVSGMGVGNNGGGTGDGGNQVPQPQGTEYTLQGMYFTKGRATQVQTAANED